MANILLIFLSLKIYRDAVSMKVEKSKKIKEKDVRSGRVNSLGLRKVGRNENRGRIKEGGEKWKKRKKIEDEG